jgi:hypothetical protein
MATWKKVIVSGSNAHLTGITSSVLTNDNLLIAGNVGQIENSGLTYDGTTLAIGGANITSTGTNSVLTGSFSGSFTGTFSGSLSVNLQDLTAGDGIEDFTYDGNSAATVRAAVTASSGEFLYWTTPIGKSKFTGSGGLSYDSINDRITVSKILAPNTTDTVNIGVNSGLRFNQVYVRDIYARSADLSLGLTVSGSTILGDASADTVTVNAQTLTLANQLAVGALSSTMLVITSSNRVATQTLGTGVATFLSTPSSANLAAAVTDETGTGTLVFSASPTFTGAVTASIISASSGITGSLFGTSSWATNALTASNIFPAITNNTDNRVLTATGGGTINGEANLTFDGSTLTNSGATTLTGRLTANGAITTTTITASGAISSSAGLLGTTLTATGNATIGGTLGVTGATTLTGALTGSAISASGNISGSTLHITGNETIGGSSTIAGTLQVTGNTTLTGDLAVNGGDITTTSTTFNLVNGTATTVNFAGGASTALNIGNTSGTTTFASNVVFNKDITVIGTASFQETTNLLVADRFILLASGSGTSPSGDGGIVIQQSGSQGVGEAFGWDATNTLRWGITSSFSANQAGFTPDAFMAAVVTAAGTTPSPATRYNAVGNIYVSSGDESIWIYS